MQQKHKENRYYQSINVFLFHGAQISQFTMNIILGIFSLSHHCFITETWNIDRTGIFVYMSLCILIMLHRVK